MNKRRVTIIVTTIAVAGLGAAALSAASLAATPESRNAEPTLAGISIVTDWHQIVLPLDSYEQSTANRQIVLQAEYVKTKACMKEFGFDFNAPKWDKDTLGDNGPSTHYRLYGLFDLVHAEEMGYHNYGDKPAIESTYNDEKHSADYYNVLAEMSGGGVYQGQQIPGGGCIGRARADIEDGNTSVDLDLPSKLNYASWTAQNSDSRVVAGFAAWSRCMSKAGYSYATPMDANNDSRWSAETASKDEIAVAVADVNCKMETNLVGLRMAVDAAYQRAAIAANAPALKAVEDALVGQTNKANAYLSMVSTQ